MRKPDYGINKDDRAKAINKLKMQQKYLNENCVDFGTGDPVPYSTFFKNAWHNSNRYIAELNHRIYSLNEYADEKGLKPIFAVITLPSEFHKKRTITTPSGKRLIPNKKFIDDDAHTPNSGNKRLQKIVRNIFNSLHFRKIPLSKRCYITTREPHKDGTPHLNLLVFVPEENINGCVEAIKQNLISEQNKVETAIKNPTAYIMKYIFKTLDDLRGNSGDLNKLTNLTLWYILHKIPRVTMSKTFVSLNIYRALAGKYDIKTLTYMYKNNLLQVFLDQNNKVVEVLDENMQVYKKRYVKEPKINYDTSKKLFFKRKNNLLFQDIEICDINGNYLETIQIPREIKPNKIPFINKMSDLQAFEYFHDLDLETCNSHHYIHCNNNLADRGFFGFQNLPMNHIDNIITDWDFEDAI